MKILLFGKSGQMGHELDIQAKLFGNKIISFSHQDLDIADFKRINSEVKKIKPDIVINATAYHYLPDCEEFPDKAFLINAIAVKNFAEITGELKIPFVHYSTDYVFSGEKGSPYIEKDRPQPLQVYGASKLAGEYLALSYNPRSMVIRSCGIYAGKKGSRSKKGNFILKMLQDKDEETLKVSSEQIVSPTYAADLAKATYELIKHKNLNGIYHLVNEGYCSWAGFAQEIMRLTGSKTKIIPVDRSGESGGARRPLFSALSNNKAKALGVKLPHWKEGLRRYISTLPL